MAVTRHRKKARHGGQCDGRNKCRERDGIAVWGCCMGCRCRCCASQQSTQQASGVRRAPCAAPAAEDPALLVPALNGGAGETEAELASEDPQPRRPPRVGSRRNCLWLSMGPITASGNASRCYGMLLAQPPLLPAAPEHIDLTKLLPGGANHAKLVARLANRVRNLGYHVEISIAAPSVSREYRSGLVAWSRGQREEKQISHIINGLVTRQRRLCRYLCQKADQRMILRKVISPDKA